MKSSEVEIDMKRQGWGWLFIALCMIMFPAMFFLCVFFPIWVGMTPRW